MPASTKKKPKAAAAKKTAAKKAGTAPAAAPKNAIAQAGTVHARLNLTRLTWPLPAHATAIVYFKATGNLIGPLNLQMWPMSAESWSVAHNYGVGNDNEILPVEEFDEVFRVMPRRDRLSINGYFHSPSGNNVDVILTFYFSDANSNGAAYPLTLKQGWNPFTIPVTATVK